MLLKSTTSFKSPPSFLTFSYSKPFMSHHTLLDPQFLVDSLYCQEEAEETYFTQNDPHPSSLLQQDLLFQDEELGSLFLKEQMNHFCPSIEMEASLANLRRDAVEWILRVVGYYSFSTLTAVLAVDYVDRFISGFQFKGEEKPWMTQLLAVSCLSLAAKFEETHVPLLLDLQVEETKYVFEAKTVKRMEILVLSTLEWKMNPVTPLSFLHHITRTLALNKYLNRCEFLLLSLLSDAKFICFTPSVMATGIMVYVINSIDPCIGEEFRTKLPNILQIDMEKFEECLKMIEDLCIRSRGFSHNYNKRKFGSLSYYPSSPKGMMDFSFNSSDWSPESESVSVSSSPERRSKKNKENMNHESYDNPP